MRRDDYHPEAVGDPSTLGSDGAERVVRIDYTRAIDELLVSVADAPSIEIFELVDDLELIFDATVPGRVVGLVVRGLRLHREAPWRLAAATVTGPTLWSVCMALATAPPTMVEGVDSARSRLDVRIPAEEWTRLRRQTWTELHLSLRRVEWWVAELPEPPLAPTREPAEGPWIVAAPWPASTMATNLSLPAPLAGACGVAPVGYARHDEDALVVSFHWTARRPVGRLRMHLAAPLVATGTVVPNKGGLDVRFPALDATAGRGLVVIVAEMAPAPVPVAGEEQPPAQMRPDVQ